MNLMLEPQKYFSASIIKSNEMGTTGISEEKMTDERLKKLLELLVKPEHNQDLDWLRLIQQYTNEIGDDLGGFHLSSMEKNSGILNHVLSITERQTPVDMNGAIRKINGQLVKNKYMSNSLYRELLRKVSNADDSYKSFWETIANAISIIQKNYLNFYAELMEDYVVMYQKYNDDVVMAAGQSVSEGKDANHVHFDGKNLRTTGYDPFESVVKNKPHVYIPNWNSLTSSQKNDMEKNLSPAFKVDAGYVIFNDESYYALPDCPAGLGKNSSGEVSLPTYQAWLAQFNSVGNTFQSNMQSFAQTYSQVNNTFNNLNKILSGTITSLGESANFVLKSIS
ncbi:IpaD/SipD/SspD family type III secretion system needle tip protein [Escherichia coli]|nr:IpaD/SipD/SspD family type III secretion system needle tip protein [Escherichia coli]